MTMPVTIKKHKMKNTFSIELPMDRFESFIQACGLYSDDFLASIEAAEQDIKYGRLTRVKSLAELMPKKSKKK